jgi:hypothetical protein
MPFPSLYLVPRPSFFASRHSTNVTRPTPLTPHPMPLALRLAPRPSPPAQRHSPYATRPSTLAAVTRTRPLAPRPTPLTTRPSPTAPDHPSRTPCHLTCSGQFNSLLALVSSETLLQTQYEHSVMSGKESTLGPRLRMKLKGEEYRSLGLRETDIDILRCRLTEHVQETERSLSLSLSLSVTNGFKRQLGNCCLNEGFELSVLSFSFFSRSLCLSVCLYCVPPKVLTRFKSKLHASRFKHFCSPTSILDSSASRPIICRFGTD